MVFITISASLAVYFIHRFARMPCGVRRRGLRLLRSPRPPLSIRVEAFAQPIVAYSGNTRIRRARDLSTPAPGDIRPRGSGSNCTI